MAGHPLDNPVWNALQGPHRHFKVEAGRFVRYRDDVNLFAGAEDPSLGVEGLVEVLPPGTMVGLVTPQAVPVPKGAEVIEIARVPQMMAETLRPAEATFDLVPLGDNHVPAMLELTGLTHPGPFLNRTIEMGRYLGIFDGKRLVAMAGERMSIPGFTEVSAVCTHPAYQGRGYAKVLVSAIAGGIVARGLTPFLHVRASNAVAIGAYEKLGFTIRHEMTFTVLKRPD
ncbi:MAG TPA: GNAT family N-acetyltransferase [Devosia sp.]|nr:GNAT family N-acetyltransferase [Devosia sp.]